MKDIKTADIVNIVSEMCIQANHYLSDDMNSRLKNSVNTEKSELGKKILNQLQENLDIADKEQIPICQDTGMEVFFVEIGQEVHIDDGR